MVQNNSWTKWVTNNLQPKQHIPISMIKIQNNKYTNKIRIKTTVKLMYIKLKTYFVLF